jgi:hypothetical protein
LFVVEGSGWNAWSSGLNAIAERLCGVKCGVGMKVQVVVCWGLLRDVTLEMVRFGAEAGLRVLEARIVRMSMACPCS